MAKTSNEAFTKVKKKIPKQGIVSRSTNAKRHEVQLRKADSYT